MRKFNKWYAEPDQNGGTEWDDVNFDDFERWALCGCNRDDGFRAVIKTAAEFCNSMIDVAIAEQRHIPFRSRAEFMEHCTNLVKRWNREAIEKPWL